MKVLIPSSLGDLIDRITILEVKLYYFTDTKKVANAKQHLAELRAVRKKLPNTKTLRELHQALFVVNKRQWNLEDKTRLYLKGKQWQAAAKHAGLVHASNAKRTTLKQQIDAHAGSHLVDEKHYAG